MQINFIHGTNYSSAPSWLTGSGGVLDQIQSFYDHLFTNNITINVTLNWVPLAWSQTATHEGGVLADNNLTSGTQGVTSSYSTLSAALVSHATNGIQDEAYSNMPTSGVSSVYIAPAEAMVLGLESKQTVNIYVNVNSSANWLGADGFGILDAFGAISHEITETGMGRISHLSGALDTMDMFRFSGGAHDLTTGATSSSTINSSAYFSIDGGATNLGYWPNDPGQGDYGDWIQGRGPVPNDSYGTVGTGESHISEVDLELMNVLGWGVAVVTSGVWSKVSAGQTFDGYTVMSGGLMTVSSGATASNTIYTDATYFDDNAVGPSSSAGADAAGFIAGTEVSATVDGGGLEWVDAGGYASATHVNAWGSIADLGETESAIVSADGVLNIDYGGYAYNTSVLSGGVVSVYSSGASNNTSVFSGGTLHIVAGGSGTEDKILNGGRDDVYGLTVLDVVSSGGSETIEAGGSAGLDAVDAGGTQIIAAGGVSDVTFVYGTQDVYGVASGDVVSGVPANQYVEAGGSAVSTTLGDEGYQYVSSGGFASATTVNAYSEQWIFSGGVASGTIVSADGAVVLVSGGSGYALTVSSGGLVEDGGVLLGHTTDAGTVSGVTVGDPHHVDELEVLSGGVASDVTVIGDADYLLVDVGGSAIGTVLRSDAYDIVYGATTGTTVSSSSTEYVDSGGAVTSSTVSSGGVEDVNLDSEATSTTVLSGGTVNLASGATGYALTVSAGGVVNGPGVLLLHTTDAGTVSGVTVGGPDVDELEVLAGGVASNVTVIITEDYLQVDSGGTATGTVLATDATDLVYGSTLSTTVSSGSIEYVLAGGVVSASTISSGGRQYVSSGGRAVGTIVRSGGRDYIVSGGVGDGAEVLSGGAEYLSSGGIASGTTVDYYGRETISSGAEARGLTLSFGGVLVDDGEVRISGAGTLDGVLSGSGLIVQAAAGNLVVEGSDAAFGGGAVISGGVIELATAGALGSGHVQFVAPTTGSAVLEIDAADAPAAGGTFANTIYDFSSAGEDIDLGSIAFVSGASATVSGGFLVLTDGGKIYKFRVAGTTAGLYPVLSDGDGGTLIDPVAAAAPKPVDPKVLAFAHTVAAFAPPDAASMALVASAAPQGLTPVAYWIGSGGAVHA